MSFIDPQANAAMIRTVITIPKPATCSGFGISFAGCRAGSEGPDQKRPGGMKNVAETDLIILNILKNMKLWCLIFTVNLLKGDICTA